MRTPRLVLLLSLAAALLACDDSLPVKETLPSTRPSASGDAGQQSPTDGGSLLPDGGVKDCFDNPKTHFEIINGCTNATRVAKNPTLPRLLADGGLPPLN